MLRLTKTTHIPRTLSFVLVANPSHRSNHRLSICIRRESALTVKRGPFDVGWSFDEEQGSSTCCFPEGPLVGPQPGTQPAHRVRDTICTLPLTSMFCSRLCLILAQQDNLSSCRCGLSSEYGSSTSGYLNTNVVSGMFCSRLCLILAQQDNLCSCRCGLPSEYGSSTTGYLNTTFVPGIAASPLAKCTLWNL